ncbi:MAG: hypothetical protein ACOCUL_01095, partial [Bacteroidota bacterium]
MKLFKKILITLLLSIATFVIGAMLVAKVYEDEIKTYVIKELNKSLLTPVQINTAKDVTLSLLKKFPNATLEFKNITIKSNQVIRGGDLSLPSIDTLCHAKTIFLEFNLVDILQKKYTIKEIHVDRAKILLLTDNMGRNNYDFIKISKNSNNQNFFLSLDKVLFTNTLFEYLYLPKKIHAKGFTKKTFFKGNFQTSKYKLNVDGNFDMEKGIFQNVNYLDHQSISLFFKLDIQDDKYYLQQGEVLIGKLKFNSQGLIHQKDKFTYLNLKIKGNELDVTSFLSLLPAQNRVELDKFHSYGNFYFNGHIKGNLNKWSQPSINVDFGIKNGTIKNIEKGYEFNNVRVEAKFSNGSNQSPETSEINFLHFSTNDKNNLIEGKGKVINFKNLVYRFQATSILHFPMIDKFIGKENFKLVSGKIESQWLLEGRLKKGLSFSVNDLDELTITGNTIFKEATIGLTDYNRKITLSSGKLMINNNV